MDRMDILEQGRMLRQHDRSSAWEFYQQVIQKAAISMDRDIWIHSSLAFAWELINSHYVSFIDRAQEIIAQVTPVADPSCPYLQLVQGHLSMLAGNFTAAITILQGIAAPEDQELQGYAEVALGRCFSIMHHFATANAHFDRAVAMLTTESSYVGFAYLYQGEMYLYAQAWEQVEACLHTALDIALTSDDDHLGSQVTYQMARLAAAQKNWEVAASFLDDAQQKVDEELDRHLSTQIILTRAEILCEQNQLAEAITYWEKVVTLLPFIGDWGVAQMARHLEGKIGIAKIVEGIVPFTEESVEDMEDLLLELAIQYEQNQVASCHAEVLRTIAVLYYYALKLATPYQYQGKSLRSLEQAIEILKVVELETSDLGEEIQGMFDQMMDGLYQLST